MRTLQVVWHDKQRPMATEMSQLSTAISYYECWQSYSWDEGIRRGCWSWARSEWLSANEMRLIFNRRSEGETAWFGINFISRQSGERAEQRSSRLTNYPRSRTSHPLRSDNVACCYCCYCCWRDLTTLRPTSSSAFVCAELHW